jgi:hypothetical protein
VNASESSVGRKPLNSRIRKKTYGLAEGRCQACGKRLSKGWHCHHILPVGSGGTDDRRNLICLCIECHKFAHGWNGCRYYSRKLKKRQYFIGTDIRTGKRVVRWWGHCMVTRKIAILKGIARQRLTKLPHYVVIGEQLKKVSTRQWLRMIMPSHNGCD